jgi:hypothetical protein
MVFRTYYYIKINCFFALLKIDMYLTDYNLKQITEKYNSIPEFLKEIERVAYYIKDIEHKNTVLGIGVYYNNLWHFPDNIVDDVINLKDLAIQTLQRLEALFIKYRFEIFDFLSKLISHI